MNRRRTALQAAAFAARPRGHWQAVKGSNPARQRLEHRPCPAPGPRWNGQRRGRPPSPPAKTEFPRPSMLFRLFASIFERVRGWPLIGQPSRSTWRKRQDSNLRRLTALPAFKAGPSTHRTTSRIAGAGGFEPPVPLGTTRPRTGPLDLPDYPLCQAETGRFERPVPCGTARLPTEFLNRPDRLHTGGARRTRTSRRPCGLYGLAIRCHTNSAHRSTFVST